MARPADEMKMTWMMDRRFEARPAVAEIDFSGEAGVDHPLEGAINRGAADAGVLAAHEVHQIVRREVAFLPQEGVQNPVAFTRSLASGWNRIHLVMG